MKYILLLLLLIPLYSSAQGVPRDRLFMKQDRCKKRLIHAIEDGNTGKALRLFEKNRGDSAAIRKAARLVPEARAQGCSRSQLIIPGKETITYRYNYYNQDGLQCRVDICFTGTGQTQATRKACAIEVKNKDELNKKARGRQEYKNAE